jgi:hypothetical protein
MLSASSRATTRRAPSTADGFDGPRGQGTPRSAPPDPTQEAPMYIGIGTLVLVILIIVLLIILL